MAFSPFFNKFPKLNSSEFRNIFILNNESYKPIPKGNYAFLELFCEDKNCDCRNVMIYVISEEANKPWAILRYGWESKKFYKEWCGADNELAQNFPGVFIDMFSPYNDISKNFLKIYTDLIKKDRQYAKRIEKHYQMFKEKIENKPIRSPQEKVGRNDLCPCQSGKKFKKCCSNNVN